ncbi:MAG TPA: hypothetical protein VNN76_01045 [Bacteroidota bacterium]|nr:hypothetical protein [Bacteroidota bacterium]
MARPQEDLEKHHALVIELLEIFKQENFKILAVEGLEGLPQPEPLHNDGYGDQEDKAPDIYAFDPVRKRYVIGEAKTGVADLETEHALTQYNVFLDQFHSSNRSQAVLYIILPSSRVPEFNSLITHYIHPDYWGNIVLVSSSKQP